MRDLFYITKSHRPVYISIAILLILIVTFILTSVVLYRYTVTLLTENLRERLITISVTAAANVDAQDLDALQTEGDWQKLEWGRVVDKLHKAKYSNKDIVFMYIFRKTTDDPTQMEFVADADSINPYANTDIDPTNDVDVNRDGIVEPDGPDKLQWPGQPYPEAVDIPEAYEAYNGPLTSIDLYTDEYGTVLTGYAPIKDDNGHVVAILATDIKADDFFIITKQTLYPFLIFIIFLTFIIFIFDILLVKSIRKQVLLREQLQVANDGQENLIHIINHQLKGYMNKARMVFDALLTDSDYGPVAEPAKPLLKQGFDSVTEGVNFVTDFLNASNIERGTYKFEKQLLDMKAIVLSAADKQKRMAEDKGLSFNLSIEENDYNLSGDKTQLEQAVRNLIDNSIRYTPKGEIKIQMSRLRQGFDGQAKDGDKILLKIMDTGVGISDALKPKLFTKGGRDENSLRVNINSTGFGLSFVKGVVEEHNGRVWAESAGPGQGSTFYMELPVSS